MKPIATETCSTCVYYMREIIMPSTLEISEEDLAEENAQIHDGTGLCRLGPPLIGSSSIVDSSRLPIVPDTYGCGYHAEEEEES